MKKTVDKNLLAMRHTCEHILTQAMLKLFPKIKMAMGPAIDNGFYFDFDPQGEKISEADFAKIEAEMEKIIRKDLPLVKKELSINEARKLFADNPYKQEWLDEIEKKGEKATVYYTGDEFVDLCSGPHVSNTGNVGPFKLLSIAGAYWRGNEKNKMLTRIYGTCFSSKQELDEYLWKIQEAKKRDHRVIGKKLGLYLLTPDVGAGLLLWTPNGAIIRRKIEELIINEQTKRGYQHVYTPHIGRKQLWQTSGHWDLYRDKMYSPMKIDDEDYLVKPMNCPFHMMIYQSQPRSYKDLPIRLAEIATVYRYEKAGELSGMLRVRHITQDDAHIFCQPKQAIDEFIGVFDLIVYLLKIFKIENYYLRLGLRSPKEKYLGNDNIWKKAEGEIIKAIKKRGLEYIKSEGDAAFYGPKLDVIIKDSLQREWQCGTIQLDFMLPERFNLEYINEKGEKERPVLIHRAPLGSLERWVAILIEHFAGSFPLWLSPTQIMIVPVSDRFLAYANNILKILQDENLRASIDQSSETVSKKIRKATLQKIPYLVIIGNKEVESYQKDKNYQISVRTREGKDLDLIDLYQFIKSLKEQIGKFL
ncbi:MAG: threonine--tRNA ligase [Patescibacteria group bacterium]|nr:threonine--tRNA ligase [Patescibacteria group bacterium]